MKRLEKKEKQREWVLFTAPFTMVLLSLATNGEGIFLTGKPFFVCLLALTLLLGGLFLWVVRNRAKLSGLDESTERKLEMNLQRLQALLRDFV